MSPRHRNAIAVFVALLVGSLVAGVAFQVRTVHVRHYVDQVGGTNLELRIAWRTR